MKLDKKFKEFENLVKELGILNDKNPVVDGNGNVVNSIFTTSEEMDIKDMIQSGNYTFDEIIKLLNIGN